MCGIAGFVGIPDPVGRVEAMLGTLVHRGPDSCGVRSGPGWAAGARRLAIVDLVTGDQPAVNEDGTVTAVLNGEIYNFRELRREMAERGHRPRSNGDTEVLVHLWEEHGPDLVHHLRGMFALAVVDEGRRQLFLARDRLGKKPLYVEHRGTFLAFASELKALQTLSPRRGLDREALAAFLVWGFVPEGLCSAAGVRRLPPGHCLLVDLDSGTSMEQRYWRPMVQPSPGLTVRSAAECLRPVLEDAVALRLQADVPVAVFLSGGIDSGVVTALAARRQPGLAALTVSFGGDDPEVAAARETARHLGVRHEVLAVDPEEGLGLLSLLAGVFDEPLADSSAIPTFLVARAARERATVVLNGDGGDEILAGYRRFLGARLAGLPGSRWWGPAAAAGAGAFLGRREQAAWALRLGRGLASSSDNESYLAWGPVKFLPSEAGLLLGRAIPPEAWLPSGALPGGPVNTLRRQDLEFFLPGDLLVKMDRATMACSLEARSPLLDQHVVELALRIPSAVLLRGWRTKAVLRAMARDLLPGPVVRRGKQGFEVPLEAWLAGPWAGLVDEVLLDPSARVREVLDGREMESWHTWSRHPDRRRAARAVFTLLILEHWLRRWG